MEYIMNFLVLCNAFESKIKIQFNINLFKQRIINTFLNIYFLSFDLTSSFIVGTFLEYNLVFFLVKVDLSIKKIIINVRKCYFRAFFRIIFFNLYPFVK